MRGMSLRLSGYGAALASERGEVVRVNVKSEVFRGGGLAVALVSMAVAVGCGGEKTDVSQGVDNINKDLLNGQHVQLGCPKEIDGGEGAVFTCTLTNTRNKKSTKLKMKVTKQNGELAVDINSEKEFQKALERIGAA